MKAMNEIKFDSNMFINGMHLMGSIKMSANLNTETERKRICNICRNYLGRLNCRILGKIKDPDCIYCSWHKYKEEEIKSIRGYRSLK